MKEKKVHKSPVKIDDQLLSDISDLVAHKSFDVLNNILADMFPQDIALIINNMDDYEAVELFKIFPPAAVSEVLQGIEDYKLYIIFNSLNITEISSILAQIRSNLAAKIILELDENIESKVLELMPVENANNIIELLQYEENEIGSVMRKEFISLKENDSIKKTINIIREQMTSALETDCILITDGEQRLKGIMKYQDLPGLLDKSYMTVNEIMNYDVITIQDTLEKKEAVKIMQKYRISSIPVINENLELVGVVHFEDISNLLQQEFIDQAAKISGLRYFRVEDLSVFSSLRSRIPWILIIVGIEFISALVISLFNAVIWKVILFACFLPLISAVSGVSAIQSSYSASIAYGKDLIRISKFRKIAERSILSNLAMSAVCSLLVFMISAYWSGILSFGLLIGMSMFASINISGLIGVYTPIIYHKMGIDPLIAANHVHAAVYDVISILIFLSLASMSIKFIL